jgi:hypothetical protein
VGIISGKPKKTKTEKTHLDISSELDIVSVIWAGDETSTLMQKMRRSELDISSELDIASVIWAGG